MRCGQRSLQGVVLLLMQPSPKAVNHHRWEKVSLPALVTLKIHGQLTSQGVHLLGTGFCLFVFKGTVLQLGFKETSLVQENILVCFNFRKIPHPVFGLT